ncbi:MAG: hypothetical protein ACI8PZ_002366 [Myxococcota bacterium]|jgi:hypothetical protein
MLTLVSALALACVIDVPSATLHGVTVSPTGALPFELDPTKVPMRVTWQGAQPVLDVRGPLAFSVQRSISELPVRTRTALALYGGRLALAAGNDPRLTATTQGSATSTLTLQGLDTPVQLPCAALTLDEAIPEPADILVPEGRHRRTWLDDTELFTAPKAIDGWRVSIRPVKVLQETDDWVQVAADYSDGSQISGWVRSADVTVVDEPQGHGRRGSGLAGLGHCWRSHGPDLDWVVLPAGATIHERAGGVAWATVPAPVRVGVFPPDDEGWVRVGQMPGLPRACDEHDRIWLAPDVGTVVWAQTTE